MKPLSRFHEYSDTAQASNLNVLQCVNMMPFHGLSRELTRSDPATINLLMDTLGRLTNSRGSTPPCQLFDEDEIKGAIEPLPGVRLCDGVIVHLNANDPDITVDDRRHYISHDLLPQVVSKLAVALSEDISGDADLMPAGTMEAIMKLRPIILSLMNMMRK